MKIRPAHSADAEALLALAKSFATSFTVEDQAFRSSLSALLADASACLRVAESDGGVIGYVLGFEHPTFFANAGWRGSRKLWFPGG